MDSWGEERGPRSLRNDIACLRHTIVMNDAVQENLTSVINKLSDEGYEQSLASCRLWFDIECAYPEILDHDQISDAIWDGRCSSAVAPGEGKLFHPTAHLFLRFTSDAESGYVFGPQSRELQDRLRSRTLRNFFTNNMEIVRHRDREQAQLSQWERDMADNFSIMFITDSNFIALWTNSGFAGETTIRNHVLQSLISHPKRYDHQVDALIVLFKIAGATLEAYVEPSVVDRCFELLKNHYPLETVKSNMAQVRVSGIATGDQ